jgi:hypothetical protein
MSEIRLQKRSQTMKELFFWIAVTVSTGIAPRYGIMALNYLVRELS